MADFNPYAPPTSDPSAPSQGQPRKKKRRGKDNGHEVWQSQGEVMIQKDGGELPGRCVVCNKRTDFRLRKTFLWHSRGLYLLALAGWLIYMIVAMIVRKSITVNLGLCDEHQQRRKNGMLIGWVGGLGSFVLMLLGLVGEAPAATFVGLVGLLVAAVIGGRMARVATPVRIDDHYGRFKMGEGFTASLPDFDD